MRILTFLTICLVLSAVGCANISEMAGRIQSTAKDEEDEHKTTSSMVASADDPRASVGLNYPSKLDVADFPTGLAFSPDGRLFFNERRGRIRVFEDGRVKTFAEVEVPRPLGYHETGLLGIALAPSFPADPGVYVYHTYKEGGRMFNKVVRFEDSKGRGVNPEVLIDKIPAANVHNGGRVAFGPDKNLYITTGDAGRSALAQDKRSLAGKVLRIGPNGDIPDDNPFGSAVFSYGHRNVFGLAFSTDGEAYVTENGPDKNDEINRLEKGGNYGWPSVTGFSRRKDMIGPLRTYTPNVAPTGATFYTGSRFAEVKGDFFFGDWNTGRLHRLELSDDGREIIKEAIVFESKEGIVDVTEAPDGFLYVTTPAAVQRVDPTILSD